MATLVVLALVAAGCGGDESASGGATTTVTITPDEQAFLDQLEAERANDPRIAAEDAMEPDLDKFAFGQELRLGPAGPTPSTLVAIVDTEIVVVNDGDEAIALRFTNGAVGDGELTETPAIEPGSTFGFTPTRPVSIRYQYIDDPEVTGHIQVDTGDFAG